MQFDKKFLTLCGRTDLWHIVHSCVGACASISEHKSSRAVPEIWSESGPLKMEME